MNGPQLREAFTRFFTERGHTEIASASLLPNDPSVMFTIAGMIPFKPIFTGAEVATVPRAVTVQKCFRTVDIDVIGHTARHITFFEMLGNFSFGDYFKADAIRYAWEFVTGVLGFDPDRLWVSVHESDEEATGLWRSGPGVAADRIQAMGDDNFWAMGPTGPCGPCSEIYYDRGEAFGAGGGPAGGGAERYVEVWNLVFMQYDRDEDGELRPLPKPAIDTGAGFERLLAVVEGAGSVFEVDPVRPVLDAASAVTGHAYGADPAIDVDLRILADHGRAMTVLVSDGVFPRNDGRGYVLRRIVRRAVLRAARLGVEEPVTPALVAATVQTLGGAYPKLVKDESYILSVLGREERRFRETLATGSALLDGALDAARGGTLAGDVAFKLHDTYGFPIELTREIAQSEGVAVDMEGFDREMGAQRERARSALAAARSVAGTGGGGAASEEVLAALSAELGPTEFTGYEVERGEAVVQLVQEVEGGAGRVVIVLDQTPFYAEGGGQAGDTGTITTGTGEAAVEDTQAGPGGLALHLAAIVSGEIREGQRADAVVDAERRARLRRNHTGTHLLHWALRRVLGDHVRQQGSLVAPDRLRFDFSHFEAMTPQEIRAVEDLVNGAVLANDRVETEISTQAEAEAAGAIAFFGEKYGDTVRVVHAGAESVELCGGTHVGGLGAIGPFVVLSEGSIGSNTRRIEALTGDGALAYLREQGDRLAAAAAALRCAPGDVPASVERALARQKDVEGELAGFRSKMRETVVDELAAMRDEAGAVVARRDGMSSDELREVALAVVARRGVEAVALAGSPDGEKAALVVALGTARTQTSAQVLVKSAASHVRGGGGGSDTVAVAGGKLAAGIDEALAELRRELGQRIG